ncbi:MAG TPA: hypothetical protein PK360_03445, partial [bacterium]|nr:hypothetical protein [bacterium]
STSSKPVVFAIRNPTIIAVNMRITLLGVDGSLPASGICLSGGKDLCQRKKQHDLLEFVSIPVMPSGGGGSLAILLPGRGDGKPFAPQPVFLPIVNRASFPVIVESHQYPDKRRSNIKYF